jgi:exodeoxyribonuclease V alpha subunit
MLQRNLLYTAITRAKRLLVLVGTKKALAIAVRNDATLRRYSRLAERLTTPRTQAQHTTKGLLTGPEFPE